jgi:hypothetical protein
MATQTQPKAPQVGKITFALIDVKDGRGPLRDLVSDHKHKVPVRLEGFITGDWSGDDGESIEFETDVTKVTLGDPVPHKCTCLRCKPRDAKTRRKR